MFDFLCHWLSSLVSSHLILRLRLIDLKSVSHRVEFFVAFSCSRKGSTST